jgi:hypothetical protein
MMKSRRMRQAGHVARIHIGVKARRKAPLGRPRCRWVDNIKMELREIGGVIWTGSLWPRIGISGGLL